MNRCQHGEKITKFCITEHCHNKESAGCDYCIKRYHFHLANTQIIQESEIDLLIQNVTVRPEIKFKSRSYQEGVSEYLKTFKHIVNTWIDNVSNCIYEKIAFPTLKKYNCLTVYNRLKNRQYKKLTGKELKMLFDLSAAKKKDEIQKEQQELYISEVQSINNLISIISKIMSTLVKQTENIEHKIFQSQLNKSKLSDIYQNIQREFLKRKQGGTKQTNKSTAPQYNNFFRHPTQNSASKEKQYQPIYERSNSSKVHPFIRQEPNEDKQKQKQYLLQGQRLKEEQKSKQRKRKYSLDRQIDVKFGSFEEKYKQIQERKKKLIEMLTPPRNQQNKKFQNKPQQLHRVMYQRVQSIHALGSKDHSDKNSLNNSSTGSQNNNSFYFNVMRIKEDESVSVAVKNILPPLTQEKKPQKHQQVQNRIIKIPLFIKKQAQQQIQSPIFNKKKKQKHKLQGDKAKPFNIGLSSIESSPQTEIKQEKLEVKQQVIKMKQINEIQSQQNLDKKKVLFTSFTNKQETKADDEQKITLGLNQKNSLLLFSQALKSPAQRAITLLNAALKYAPNNLSAGEYLSYLLLQSNKAKDCLDVCEDILFQIEDKPQQFEMTIHLHNNKAAALNMLGRYSQSILILQKCLKYRRKDYFYKNLADAYFSLGIHEKAALNYNKALTLNDQYDETYYNLAVCQFIQEEYKSCLLNVDNAIKINSQQESYHDLKRECRKKLDCFLK